MSLTMVGICVTPGSHNRQRRNTLPQRLFSVLLHSNCRAHAPRATQQIKTRRLQIVEHTYLVINPAIFGRLQVQITVKPPLRITPLRGHHTQLPSCNSFFVAIVHLRLITMDFPYQGTTRKL